MRKLTAVAVMLAFAFPSVAAARSFSARSLSDGHVGRSRAELVAQIRYSSRVVNRLAGTWRVAPRHASCWSHVPWARVCDSSRRRLLAHRWLLSVARARYQLLYAAPVVGPSWLVSAFECIHRFEGAWNDDTGNGYYGGLQMDIGFQQEYGAAALRRYGTADHWPPSVQLAVAIVAYDSGRGFGPWPNTSRACGL